MTNASECQPHRTCEFGTPGTATSDAVCSEGNYVMLDAGAAYTCAIERDGSVACWGNNADGQLGNGNTRSRSAAVKVKGAMHAKAISAGSGYDDSHACMLGEGGTVSCWGANGSGELGDGTNTQREVPVTVPSVTNVTAIAAGGFHTCALMENRAVACWGENGSGQLAGQSHLI
jgi:alpha-tubulin suppressor-like RCC1 family protein